jgi:Domain of unknown function (DUF4349)
MTEHRTMRLVGWSVLAVVLVLIATAFALGGRQGSSESGGASGSVTRTTPAGTTAGGPTFGTGSSANRIAASGVPEAAPSPAQAQAGGIEVQPAVDAVTATRVVKTGDLELTVGTGKVGPTMTRLVTLTHTVGGYVSQSQTSQELGSPTGELTIRMPVDRFDTTVTAAQRLGHTTSLTTNARDVTGRVVDLGARVAALEQTRATYLAILGRARTIGATLEVQQKVDEVQQQIEELQGELKVLADQSADGTLTVDVTQKGAPVAVHHHHRGGLGQAWHTSISRFNRGFDAIVSALGPLLLAVLLLGVLAAIAALGYRGVRRVTP